MLDLANALRLLAIVNEEMEGAIVAHLRDDAEIYEDSSDSKLLVELANAIEAAR